MTKKIIFLFALLGSTGFFVFGQHNDWEKLNLRGKVKSLETNTYFLEVPNSEYFKSTKAGDYKPDYENGIRAFNVTAI